MFGQMMWDFALPARRTHLTRKYFRGDVGEIEERRQWETSTVLRMLRGLMGMGSTSWVIAVVSHAVKPSLAGRTAEAAEHTRGTRDISPYSQRRPVQPNIETGAREGWPSRGLGAVILETRR